MAHNTMSTSCSTGSGVAGSVAMSTVASNLKLDPGGTTETPPDRRSSSPEDSCAICLGKPENKSFTDSCFHTFCFSCLLEWSKVKAECPLCKKHFKSIVHNVRSFEDYDRYFVSNNNNGSSGAAAGSAAASAAAAATSVVAFNALLVASRYAYMPILNRRYQQHNPHMIGWPAMTTRHVSGRRRRTATPRAFTPRAFTPRTNPELTSSTERRSLYDLNLWVRLDRRRSVQVTPVQYRDNHSLAHRLIPWLTRELDALLGSGPQSQASFVLGLILGLVTHHTVCSPEFVEEVRPFFGQHTAHFIHEFYAFAVSPHDMVTYDRCATYEPMAVALERRSPAAPFLRDAAMAAEAAADPSQPGPSGLQRGPVVQVLESESDDSDCFVVDVVQQREPVVIELSSGDEGGRTEVTPPAAVVGASAEAATVTATPALTPRRKKAPQKRRRSWQRVCMSDSDSSSDDDLTIRVSAARRTQVPPRRGVVTVSHGCSLKLRIESFAGSYFGRSSNGGEGEEGAGTGTTEEPCSSRQALERAARNKRAHQRRLRQRESSDEE